MTQQQQEEQLTGKDRAAELLDRIHDDCDELYDLVERMEMLQDDLQAALDSRILIEQAKGVIMGTYMVDAKEAFGRLRGYSRDRNIKIHDVCAALLTDVARGKRGEIGRYANKAKSHSRRDRG